MPQRSDVQDGRTDELEKEAAALLSEGITPPGRVLLLSLLSYTAMVSVSSAASRTPGSAGGPSGAAGEGLWSTRFMPVARKASCSGKLGGAARVGGCPR